MFTNAVIPGKAGAQRAQNRANIPIAQAFLRFLISQEQRLDLVFMERLK